MLYFIVPRNFDMITVMEQVISTKCLECTTIFTHVKTLARHVKTAHSLHYIDYLKKNGKSEISICHCGKSFENTRYPGGPRSAGRRQLYCSSTCNQWANSWKRVYGLDPEDYWNTLEKQGGACAICKLERGTENRMLAVDHEHIDGYEDMSPEEKRKHFRGLLCLTCNRWRVAKNDLDTARAIVLYLESHQLSKQQ